uniref:Plastocyanin-like domain-containing protein n=1 Tax=Nymphaea colorata TaxID=210225 RepID=A0A5K1HWN6_9MAGN|nr:unnamed protein product [Nymphaea colorata]
MKAHIATRIRIRWTKNSYNESLSSYPYFNFGEDELMEFPGMVYHCHILPHEENMMMRPIMMQPSDKYLALLANNSKASSEGKCYYGSSWMQN